VTRALLSCGLLVVALHSWIVPAAGAQGTPVLTLALVEDQLRGGVSSRRIRDNARGSCRDFEVAVGVRRRLAAAGADSALVAALGRLAACAPTARLRPSTVLVRQGQGVTLAWQTTRATGVRIEPGVGSVAASGEVQVAPTATTTYTLTATGAGGSATSTAHVQVAPSSAPPPPRGAFRLVGSDPVSGAEGVMTHRPLRLIFASAIDPASVGVESVELRLPGGPALPVRRDVVGDTLVLTPIRPFPLLSTLQLTLRPSLRSRQGEALPGEQRLTLTTFPFDSSARYALHVRSRGLPFALETPAPEFQLVVRPAGAVSGQSWYARPLLPPGQFTLHNDYKGNEWKLEGGDARGASVLINSRDVVHTGETWSMTRFSSDPSCLLLRTVHNGAGFALTVEGDAALMRPVRESPDQCITLRRLSP